MIITINMYLGFVVGLLVGCIGTNIMLRIQKGSDGK